MSLWVDLYGFSDDDRIGDLDLSDAARWLVTRDTIPLRTWTFGDETFIKFCTSQYLHVAVSLVQRYVKQQYDAYCVLQDASDFEFKHCFTVSFIDNR